MPKKYLALLMVLGLGMGLLSCTNLTDVGGTTTTSTTTTTVQQSGVVLKGITANLGSSGLSALAIDPTEVGNPNFLNDVIITPESYAVGLWKVELLKGVNDTTPYTIQEFAATSEAPVHFPLTSTSTNMANNTDYPAAGTYTVFKPTIAYLEMQLPSAKVDMPEDVTKFRVYVSTVGDIPPGDILLYVDEAWKWLDTDTGEYSAARPDNPAQHKYFGEGDSPDPFQPTDIEMDSVVIPDSPSGLYTATLSFDVSNTFFFDDLDKDGVFEPTTDDKGTDEQIDQYGTPDWFPGAPSMSLSMSAPE